MTLTFDDQTGLAAHAGTGHPGGAHRGTGPTGSRPADTFPDTTLAPALVSDLLLGLAGVLPDCQVLGGPVTDVQPTHTGSVTLVLPSAQAASLALAAGGLVLRDEEHTPLAALGPLVPAAGRDDAVMGVPRRMRMRESRTASHAELNFDHESLHHRPVLVISRPATAADVVALRRWCEDKVAPVVLVAEQSERRDRVSTGTLLRLVESLVGDLGTPDADILTVPLEGRDAPSDAELVRRIGARLHAVDVRAVLDDQPRATAAVWASTRSALLDGRDVPALGEFPATAHDLLTRWRQPRSRRGLVIMFTGFSGSGKSTLARDVTARITTSSTRTVSLLDGDRVRQLLSSGLGFDEVSRELNVRRIGFVATEVARHGGIAICSPIAPCARTRAEVREMAEAVGDFLLVHVSTPLDECERRDLKGLYAAARQGAVGHFTGISAPYDVPTDADLRVDTSHVERGAAAGMVLDTLVDGGWLTGGDK
jgi:adenylyl-sulfate kinase